MHRVQKGKYGTTIPVCSVRMGSGIYFHPPLRGPLKRIFPEQGGNQTESAGWTERGALLGFPLTFRLENLTQQQKVPFKKPFGVGGW